MQRRGRIRVLPGSLLPGCSIPVEPLEPPPPPKGLVSLLIVGDSNSGKSSLVRSFVSHESIPLGTGRGEGGEEITSSSQKNDKKWSVAYTKKDEVFSDKHNCLRTLRAQLWDTTGANISTPAANMERAEEWKVVWGKAACILLVLPLRASSWDETSKKIKDWKQRLDNQHQVKPVVLMLHQGDRLQSASTDPTDWILMGKRISDLCHDLRFQSWHVTSSCLEHEALGNSIDTAFRAILGDLSKSRFVAQRMARSASGSMATTVPTEAATVTPEKEGKTCRAVSPLT